MEFQEADFRRFLAKVEERDVDLLLMEEFHVSADFVAWFASMAGLGREVGFLGAWHSVSDQDGETDLLLRVKVGSDRVGILIENKVAAPHMPNQDGRYFLRGQRCVDEGSFDRFVTVICAPQRYLDGLPASMRYEHRVPYETIRDWYGQQEGKRASWRSRIMAEAIEQGRRGYVMQVHAPHTAFHRAYWQHVRSNHPRFLMREPKDKGPKSDWIMMRTSELPKGVQVFHKMDKSCVELMFERTLAEPLQAIFADRPPDMFLLQRGGSAALSLDAPRIDHGAIFGPQAPAAEEALALATQLVDYFMHRSRSNALTGLIGNRPPDPSRQKRRASR